jgi:hypothetical protein
MEDAVDLDSQYLVDKKEDSVQTYKKPRRNIQVNAILRLTDICNFHRIGIGVKMTTRSVMESVTANASSRSAR